MKKILLIAFAVTLFFGAYPAKAQTQPIESSQSYSAEAKIIKILEQREITRDNGSTSTQQDLELLILSGSFKGQTKTYYGVSDLDVVSTRAYKTGDRVIVNYNSDSDGNYSFYITDFVRTNSLIYLTILFVLVVFLVGGKKGFMALFSLAISFFLIIKVLVPAVFKGYDPLFIGIIISFAVLLTLIYFTEGWNKKSHIAILSIVISLLITAVLAWIFGNSSRLSGAANEEIIFLIDAIKVPVDFYRLLLASIIIGTLGVLDDIVVGQIESVYQIKEANPRLKAKQVFKMGMSVGRTHLGAIINTLFLAYVSVSLPLVLLFNVNQEPFLSVAQIINHEDIATEIVRTLVGAIGLCLAAPLATFLSAYYLKVSNTQKYD